MAKKKLSPLWAATIKGALNLIKAMVTARIPDDFARKSFTMTLQPTTNIVDAMADDNMEDGAQIVAIILEHTNKNILPFGEEQFQGLLAKMKDQDWALILKTLGSLPFEVGRIYTDNEPNNERQLLEMLESWLENPEVQRALLVGLFSNKLLPLVFKKNPEITGFIAPLLEAYIASGGINFDLNKDGE